MGYQLLVGQNAKKDTVVGAVTFAVPTMIVAATNEGSVLAILVVGAIFGVFGGLFGLSCGQVEKLRRGIRDEE